MIIYHENYYFLLFVIMFWLKTNMIYIIMYTGGLFGSGRERP